MNTKTQILVDYDVNQHVKNEVDRKRKFESSEITKDRQMGIMIEERFTLDKALSKKKMTFDELIIFLKK